MTRQELKNLFAGWREIARPDFWLYGRTDSTTMLKLVLVTALVFAVDVLKLIFLTPESRERLRNE